MFWILRMLTYEFLKYVHFCIQSFTELMDKIYIRQKYIQTALILNCNQQHTTSYMISMCIQRTYFKYLIKFSILIEEIYDQKPQYLNSNISRGTYEQKRKLFHFPAKYLSWLQQTSYIFLKVYTTVSVHIKKNCI